MDLEISALCFNPRVEMDDIVGYLMRVARSVPRENSKKQRASTGLDRRIRFAAPPEGVSLDPYGRGAFLNSGAISNAFSNSARDCSAFPS